MGFTRHSNTVLTLYIHIPGPRVANQNKQDGRWIKIGSTNTSLRRIDTSTMSFRRHVPAGYMHCGRLYKSQCSHSYYLWNEKSFACDLLPKPACPYFIIWFVLFRVTCHAHFTPRLGNNLTHASMVSADVVQAR